MVSEYNNHNSFIPKEHSDQSCMFFIGENLITNLNCMTPFLLFGKTTKELKLKILHTFILEGTILIIECHNDRELIKNEQHKYQFHRIKDFLAQTHLSHHSQILKAFHWINWHNQAKYCGRCGQILKFYFNKPEKKCLSCNSSIFPRFSPAIMVLIHDRNKILLARSPHFPKGQYSAIAGFIDLGETAEQAVHREVKEELGIEVTDLEYFSSQTWPFPDSFMIAFKARYLKGKIIPQPDEIEDYRWFNKDEPPKLPNSASIAVKLINSFYSI
ncbi:MAG: NAD(+) diphosphatase [Legionellales bacterium]|nr:NAD(+) diphosphatase [Legionellales bacterium]